ncbi:MAG TPA: branched-chain amino acid ABC transporter permease [Desulfobacterales bacterium]|nr:branched-chain amino acid ABC transporter permease [Desulfobacterales bacterium]
MDNLIQQIVNGLTLGCIYGLLALSYTLIFGVLRVINFALGETLMVGAFASISAVRLLERSPLIHNHPLLLFGVGLAAAMLGGVAFALTTEVAAFRPLRRKRGSPVLLGLISSLGVSIFVQNFVLVFVDSGNVSFPQLIPKQNVQWLGATVSTLQIAIILLSTTMMVFVSLIVYKTKIGQQIRAVRDNLDLARGYGTNPNTIVTATFALAGLLAGLSGFMIGCQYEVSRYNIGFVPGIKAFSAAILGGIGDVPGGVIGGIIIGLVEALGAGYISAENKDVFVFSILIFILLFRSRGLLNRGIE